MSKNTHKTGSFRSLALIASMGTMMLTPQTVAAADPLPVFYTCSFSCEDVVLQVTVNGFPLYSLPSSGNSGSQTSLIAQFFRKGTNEVLIQATPQNGADGNPKSSHIFVAELFGGDTIESSVTSVLKVQKLVDRSAEEPTGKTVFEAEGAVLAQLKSVGSQDGGTMEYKYPTKEVRYLPANGVQSTLKLTLELPQTPLDNLPWLSPPPVIDATEQIAIKQAVMAFHSALVAQDWATVTSLLDVKYERVATAGGIAKADVVTQTQAVFDEAFSSAGFVIAPLAPADLTVVPIAGLNLVKVEKAGVPPIRGAGTKYNYAAQVFLSKIAGIWRIVE